MKIYLADNQSIYRTGLAAFLRQLPFVDRVDEGSSAFETLASLRQSRVNLLLVDFNLPGGGGLGIVRSAVAERLALHVAVLMESAKDNELFDAIREGAEGCIARDISPPQLETILVRLSMGFLPFSPELERLFYAGVQKALQRGARFSLNERRITTREQQVLKLLQMGLTNKEIALHLCISENTVKNHVRSIIEKFQVQNRMQAVASAIREDLLRDALPSSIV